MREMGCSLHKQSKFKNFIQSIDDASSNIGSRRPVVETIQSIELGIRSV